MSIELLEKKLWTGCISLAPSAELRGAGQTVRRFTLSPMIMSRSISLCVAQAHTSWPGRTVLLDLDMLSGP